MSEEYPYFDTRIRSNLQITDNHNMTYINVGESGGVVYRTLMLFKFCSIPANLKSAVLSLFWNAPVKARKSDTIIEIYRPAAWAPNGVGWNYSVKGLKWKNGGGDWFDRNGKVNGNTPFASVLVKATDLVGKYIDIDITDLINGIRAGDYPNTGILLKSRTEKGDYLEFSSLEGPNKPKISYIEGQVTTPDPEEPSEPEELEEPEEPENTQEIDLTGYTIVEGPGSDALATIQAAINKAVVGKGIYLKGPATYKLGTGHIVLKSGVSIGGDKSAVVFGGTTTGGVVRGSTPDGWFYGSGVSDLKLFGFTLSSAAALRDGGLGETRNCILLRNCHDIEIFDIDCLKYMYNDFVKCFTGNKIVIHDNIIQGGHDGIQFLKNSQDCEAYNNDVEIRINCGMRIDNGKNIRLHHNKFTGQSGTGWCVFEIENSVVDCEIDHNIAHDWTGSQSRNAFTQNVHATVKNLNVHDNVMWNTGTPGIGTLKNNIINPTDRNIDSWIAKGYGPQKEGA